ncbi:MAG TPA: methylated-DNA--[protein]-cysteine S-methyltransferase [Caulobacteraceae bacterium]
MAAQQTFFEERFLTPTGEMRILTDDGGRLRAADWDNHGDRQLARHYGENGFRIVESGPKTKSRERLEAYFAGDIGAIEAIETRTGGTEFQKAVWSALRRIPAGQTISYAGLAANIGHAAAVRAVGLANGANPIVIVVPCHRVIGADGTLTGYGGGLDRKRWLLDHERAAEEGHREAALRRA